MRSSQLLARRTRSLIKTSPLSHRALLSSSIALCYPRKDTPSLTPRLSKRASSTTPNSSSAPDPTVDPEDAFEVQIITDSPGLAPDSAEKPKRRPRATFAPKDGPEPPQLPSGLDVLWTPEPSPGEDTNDPLKSPKYLLPPTEIFEEALDNLHLTLHPRVQHRSVYAPVSGSTIEPTLALYCPIEGGEYVIDETVRELARKTDADVVVLDAAQIAAGESGVFGKAATALQLPINPLHFPSSPPASPRMFPRPEPEDEEEDEGPQFISAPQSMTLHVMSAVPARSSRMQSSQPRGSSMLKAKSFFDEIINVSARVASTEDSGQTGEAPPSAFRRPRIVYIRDFPTLAPSSTAWYPALLSSVRQRRQGPISRPSSPVVNPTTIIFGVTPSIVPPPPRSSPNSPGPHGLVSLLMSRQNAPSSSNPGPRVSKSVYSEDEVSDKARERRLRDRLKRWDKGDAVSLLQAEIPQLLSTNEGAEERNTSGDEPEVVVLGAPIGFPSALASALSGRSSSRSGPSEPSRNISFFRTSIVVPSVRSMLHEKSCRISRRREINELTMRMGVAAVGGRLEKMESYPDVTRLGEEGLSDEETKKLKMWDQWGRAVEVWPNVRKIADRAVGDEIAYSRATSTTKPGLEPTPVTWSTIHEAWGSHKAAREEWKAWMKSSFANVTREEKDDNQKTEEDEVVDEVVERIKRDPELDQHEQRLLGCIVDTATLSTSFSQVHLPPHTIDSVRTIVSLPLLHPAAFQHGILKEHGMTGCLLFGPPGTGKTLVVRALAKEAGCRMLAISPSDVMDMYVGEGEKLVRSVFTLARRLSPCVVFIDEIDALFGARMSVRESGGAIAHRGVITEFMQEMDGLKSSKEDNVIVIGATNRPFDLDDAVLRRLPRRLLVDLPGEKEREEILKILLRDEILATDIDLMDLARKTESFSGSDLKHLCVSAALDAVKETVAVPWKLASSHDPKSTITEPAVNVAERQDTSSQVTPSSPGPVEATVVLESVESPPEENSSVEATPDQSTKATDAPSLPSQIELPRTLSARNFKKALLEITPSASESLGSLADLRKWNKEFGEGRRERKRQVWGKGRFGFTLQSSEERDVNKIDIQPATVSSTTELEEP